MAVKTESEILTLWGRENDLAGQRLEALASVEAARIAAGEKFLDEGDSVVGSVTALTLKATNKALVIDNSLIAVRKRRLALLEKRHAEHLEDLRKEKAEAEAELGKVRSARASALAKLAEVEGVAMTALPAAQSTPKTAALEQRIFDLEQKISAAEQAGVVRAVKLSGPRSKPSLSEFKRRRRARSSRRLPKSKNGPRALSLKWQKTVHTCSVNGSSFRSRVHSLAGPLTIRQFGRTTPGSIGWYSATESSHRKVQSPSWAQISEPAWRTPSTPWPAALVDE